MIIIRNVNIMALYGFGQFELIHKKNRLNFESLLGAIHKNSGLQVRCSVNLCLDLHLDAGIVVATEKTKIDCWPNLQLLQFLFQEGFFANLAASGCFLCKLSVTQHPRSQKMQYMCTLSCIERALPNCSCKPKVGNLGKMPGEQFLRRDRQTDRQTDRHTERQTDGQTDRQTDRQAGRLTDRQTDRTRTGTGQDQDRDRTGPDRDTTGQDRQTDIRIRYTYNTTP